MRARSILASLWCLFALSLAFVGLSGEAKAQSGWWVPAWVMPYGTPYWRMVPQSLPRYRPEPRPDYYPIQRRDEPEARGGAPITVHVSLGAQAMTVALDGEPTYRWSISSGRIGYGTPHGSYRPQRLALMWRSRKYQMAPMPYSIFFRGGYAIHGTYATAYLGARASHGCIRLSTGHAATLYGLVRAAGFGHTRIVIGG